MPIPVIRTSAWIKVRNSKIHGKGVFAAKRIPRGTRVIEYLGGRITHAEADARHDDHDPNDNHTFLFIVDKKTVIDAGVGGNDARFINHSCDDNCESVIQERRVFIETTRVIEKGEELGYDYKIGREKDDPPNVDEIFACRCGSPRCRGTMLWPAKDPRKKKKAKTRAKTRTKTQSRSTSSRRAKASRR
ncbi:MAG: SET domain-containing protein [Gammaproteobacteria bacterium]|nr:SET domain-containing protein [Gammaproteobacteria bacterium]